jgi:DNA-directed RNA polymerase specialized sigma24 family protein
MADDEQSWRETLVEIALRQLMNDESIQSRTRQVFLRVTVNGEKPDDVAAAFGINRNAVDQIKNRMMPRLQKIVAALEKAGNI